VPALPRSGLRGYRGALARRGGEIYEGPRTEPTQPSAGPATVPTSISAEEGSRDRFPSQRVILWTDCGG
jgi:hypothetical protein